MSDGSQLRQSWLTSLSDAESHFRTLISSQSSGDWKRVSTTNSSATTGSIRRKARTKVYQIPEVSDVVVHRTSKYPGDDVYRLILDLHTYPDEPVTLEPWKLVLSTPEIRQEWDPAVQDATVLELFDSNTRICKTNFTLGWPANPRDTVTISRTVDDPTTLIDVSTSLPRSPDEPAYLRPSPPFVRSNVALFAWCVQHLPSPSNNTTAESSTSPTKRRHTTAAGRIRITCFWQHDLRAAWNFSTAGFTQQLSTMMVGLAKSVAKRGNRIPKLIGYGHGISMQRANFSVDREALSITYTLIPEDDGPHEALHDLDELHALKEQRRLTRSVECTLPAVEGWDVQVLQKGSSAEMEKHSWSTFATYRSSYGFLSPSTPQDQILLRISHSELPDQASVLKVTVILELSGPSSGWRLNGIPQPIKQSEERDPSSYNRSSSYNNNNNILPEMSSFVPASSFSSASSMASADTSSSSLDGPAQPLLFTQRTPAAEKSILSRVRRNYIYFSSLLQEPEAKWKRTTDARGVSVTQLDSIDPTLVVYKAEATFVGVGLWDMFAVVASPGSRAYWDKQHEDATLLEDVSGLTDLWYFKTKPAWPVTGRDSVLLKTVYKSPTSIHVFLFTVDDTHLFPNIPSSEPNTIRAQVDLQGWVIEALSPNTTQLTLLEQSDPKGWSNKTSIPTQMVNALAGIGEFAIKLGGPPVLTRLDGGKASDIRYDHERSTFRLEYEPSSERLNMDREKEEKHGGVPVIECEIRCDLDTWGSSLDIVVDPPPQSIACLRRHKLSANGGGLWLTLTHDSIFVDDERLLVIIRKGPGKEKGVVMVNGSRVNVDVEDLPDSEIKSLVKKKRIRPPRIPLDQPPVVGVVRKRRAEWDADTVDSPTLDSPTRSASGGKGDSSPKTSSPLSRFWSFAVTSTADATQNTVTAVAPTSVLGNSAIPSASKLPMQYALDALAWTQEAHSRFGSAGWALLGDKDVTLHRKMCPEISPVIPVHKGEKIIEGVAAEELASVISASSCRKKWDDRFDRARVLHSYGADCRTSFLSSKANFPFRDRGFYVASLTARAHLPPSLIRQSSMSSVVSGSGPRNALFCVSASYSSESASMFDSTKFNAANMPIGRIFVDAWILETLDPYTKENYAVPSTRCIRLVSVDYGGSIPAAVNTMINSSLPRQILALESFVKNSFPAQLPLMRMPATGLLVSNSSHDDDDDEGEHTWKLRRRDEKRTLVSYYFANEEKLYRAVMVVVFPAHRHSRETTAKDTTPRPSLIIPSPPPRQAASLERVRANSASSSPVDPPPSMTSSVSSLASDATVTVSLSTPAVSGLPRARTPSPHRLPGLPTPSSSPLHAVSAPNTPYKRQRTQSAAPKFHTASTVSPSTTFVGLRGRAPTAALSLKASPPKDLVIAEIVIDSRMYTSEGGYDIKVRSWLIHDDDNHPVEALQTIIPSTVTPTSSETPEEPILPLVYSMYTLPSSALHSSSTSESGDGLIRHMMRATLSTAKYDIQTLEDPLTGELQSAPERPDWLLHLEAGGRVGVSVDVVPKTAPMPKSKVRSGKRKICDVNVNGDTVKILDEKESLGAIGREELLPPDEGVGRWAVITRIPKTLASVFPSEFETPVGAARDLLKPPSPLPAESSDSITPLATPLVEFGRELGTNENGSVTPISMSASIELPRGTWMDYLTPKNFRILPWGATTPTPIPPVPSTNSTETIPLVSRTNSQATDGDAEAKLVDALPAESVSAGSDQKTRRRRREPGLYRTQTLLATALIAFLFGSLLRSLIAPVDYVFVPSTSTHHIPSEETIQGEQHPVGGQWREMKRLGEFKVKGWDLVIGVVRHRPL
ncbi:hypothetical protein DL96DRAFT_1650631 [Flagelloscypha sp. PMI_526]|nr:hypothetical protein DL96DRAFT_1650631 [Flagelloscypha sp. PMI_526]